MDPKKPPSSGLADTDPAVADTHASEPGATTTPEGAIIREPGPKGPRQVRSGDSLGRYDLLEEIGEGGMASVFRARDKELRRDVAVKVLFPHLARREEVVRRFHREARAAANLEHPNILRIYDVGGSTSPGDDTPPFIVMELIRGRTLLEEIEQRGPVFAEVTACIGALLADALAAAHAKGIIHRDIKPSNVLIAHGGRLLLADFGVARLETEDSSLVTRTGALLGTPAYMSPEQASGDTATVRSDLYSLGATLYQLSTGMLPYAGSPAKVMSMIAMGAMVPPVKRRAEVGPDLSHAITKMMAVDPQERPQTAASIAIDLRGLAATSGFGDATEELAAYFDDAAKFLDDKRPRVVSAIVSAGKKAIAESKLPRAMALADRASALAPEDPSVKTLVETVTEGDRGARRRKVIGIAALGVLLAGGAVAAVTQLGGATTPPDAAQVAIADSALVVDSAPVAPDVALEPDAAAVLEDARASIPVARDAQQKRDAAVTVAAPPDVAIELPDAPVAVTPDAPAAPQVGTIIVTGDVWCMVSVDGISRGRFDPGRPVTVELPAGPHVVTCEQAGMNGGKGERWVQNIVVAAGGAAAVKGALLKPVAITVAITTGDRLEIAGKASYPRNAKLQLMAGRYTATVWSGDKRGVGGSFDIRFDCRIHEVGQGLVCDP